ncbi:AAA family ATPase [Corynebacterium halotolerans]|uniref:AAA family ATPase n=1 Tax=Corynebacterium halotolerans TaxID=225326 RepID=UPI000349FC51|nr:ATP-binding protein [Corynebacterium halotolerans]
MITARLVELRLTDFKSFHGSILPLKDITLLTGRNSSGKSNALDGLEVLSRLAGGEDLADALDGRRREGGAVRGGSRGCAPHGSDHFSLGCTVVSGKDSYTYDVAIQVSPDLRVISESLRGPTITTKSGTRNNDTVIFQTKPTHNALPGIETEVYSGKRGVNPTQVFRDSRLVLTQIPLALPGLNRTEKSILQGAEAVALALRGTFHVDPLPHLMRSFVPGQDVALRRTGENLSAALRSLEANDPSAFAEIVELTRKVADDQISGISFATSSLQDVMLQLEETRGGTKNTSTELTPAREMSDGLLRILGIATTLKSARSGLDIDSGLSVSTTGLEVSGSDSGVLIVIEELENGLHPSQAHRVLDLIRNSHSETGARVLATTHSPALLDAAEGTLNDSIIVCHRNPTTGYSQLTALTELPGYARALAEGTLGDAVTAGKLVDDVVAEPDYSDFQKFLGVS